ncbi:fumarylacetoacetate hydrolase family protein [Fusobacterium sp.]|uniref:fumarylacetoacetate hydrolase family protein n=1 Tax=Fusobacterium sp. TaxID=68766 RepID=UPI0025C0BA9A|nr:fumarylacetoacetate hydrolase family protein [Fusobacterium sp.]MCI7223715.1 fumarylacetoacetate hydrolase family protein [Fusobacterium sp.]
MKFLTFLVDNKEKVGMLSVDEEKIIEISEILDKKINSMLDLIKIFSLNDVEKIKREFLKNKKYYQKSDVKILSPIRKPIHDIICVGLNYREHIKETENYFKINIEEKAKTVYFSKRAIEIIGQDDSIISRLDLDKELDYEAELAVIIGKDGKNISEEKAEEYIFGYSIFNDISARTLQRLHNQWYRGKSLDTFSSMGPVIVYKDELLLPIEVEIKSRVNNQLRQESNTKYMLKSISQIISEISEGITLEAGDIIITGTPAGVGLGYEKDKFLKRGDIVECEISGIGILRNTVK